MLYQETGAFNCTYNTISSKARVSDETTQPLENTQHTPVRREAAVCVTDEKKKTCYLKYHGNPRETKPQPEALDHRAV